MNIAVNPWSFTSADVPAAVTASASPAGMVQQGKAESPNSLRIVLLTTTGAHGLTAGQWITYINDTNGRFNGWYRVIAAPTGTTALLENISTMTSGMPISTVVAASGGGGVLVNQVQQNVRAEDLSIMATGTPGATALILLDRNGFPIWSFMGAATVPGFVSQSRGKPMWVDGLTLQSIPTNCIVLMTIN